MAQTINVDCRVVGFREEDLSWAVSRAEVKVGWSPTDVLFGSVSFSPTSPPRILAST